MKGLTMDEIKIGDKGAFTKTIAVNQDGETVIDGEAVMMPPRGK